MKNCVNCFVALDFETPNGKNNCPCSAGIAVFKNGVLTETHYHLINPEEEFYSKNVEIHGITAEDVSDSVLFYEWWNNYKNILTSYPIVAHNVTFDMSVLKKAFKKYQIEIPNLHTFCTKELAELNITDCENYTLECLCDYYGIELFHHHNALDDAIAAGRMFLELTSSLENAEVLNSKQSQKKRTIGVFETSNVIVVPELEQKKIYFSGQSKIGNDILKDIIVNIEHAQWNDIFYRNTDFFIISEYAWSNIKNGRFSEKYEKALNLQNKGLLKIYREKDFLDLLGITYFSKQKKQGFKTEPSFTKANIQFDIIDDFNFSGKKIVITGKSSIERSQLKVLLEKNGAKCIGAVSKNVSALLIGPEDTKVVIDPTNAKSGKIIKAEELRNKGIDIKFFDIEEFINKYYEY